MNKYFSPTDILQEMEYGHEFVDLDADIPFRAFLHGPAEIPYHWHPELEILAVLRGTVRLDVSGGLCEMSRGDIMIINANDIHNSMAWSSDAVVIGIHLNAEHYEAIGLPGFTTHRFLCKSFLHGKSFEAISEPIRALIARIILSQPTRKDQAMIGHVLAGVLCFFIYSKVPWDEIARSGTSGHLTGRERILAIMRRVRSSDGATVGLAKIASEEGLTVSHLSRLFKSHVGIGYRDYIQNIRLDRAVRELRMTRNNIATIMGQTGFTNPTHFFSKFKGRFGCSPAEYRRLGARRNGGAETNESSEREILALLLEELGGLQNAFDLLGLPKDAVLESLAVAAPHNVA